MRGHLDERASDYVDGRLNNAEAAAAVTHLAGCRGCRDLVEAERLTKSRLAALDDPAPTQAFTAALLAIGGSRSVLGAEEAPHPGVATGDSVEPAGSTARLGHRVAVGANPDDGPSGSRRPQGPGRAMTRPSGRLAGFRRGRRSDRARAVAVLAVSLGMTGVGLLGTSVVSASVNASVTPTANLTVARHVVTMGGMPMLNLLPAWRAVDVSGGR